MVVAIRARAGRSWTAPLLLRLRGPLGLGYLGVTLCLAALFWGHVRRWMSFPELDHGRDLLDAEPTQLRELGGEL